MFLVICTDTDPDHGTRYYLATHTIFRNERDADRFKATIDGSRLPLVVCYDGKPLRDDAHERGPAFNADPA